MVVYYNLLAGGTFGLVMEPTAIGLVSLNSTSETQMTAICDGRLIYGRGRISPVFISCGPLINQSINQPIRTMMQDLFILHHSS